MLWTWARNFQTWLKCLSKCSWVHGHLVFTNLSFSNVHYERELEIIMWRCITVNSQPFHYAQGHSTYSKPCRQCLLTWWPKHYICKQIMREWEQLEAWLWKLIRCMVSSNMCINKLFLNSDDFPQHYGKENVCRLFKEMKFSPNQFPINEIL